ncbi:MAG: hypothetical protein ABSB78_13660 [Bacteroidota bacterium]
MNEHEHMDESERVNNQKTPFDFHNLLPIIEDIMLMVHESLKKIPHVTSNLNKVTERYERVTAEILGVVDRLNENIDLFLGELLIISDSLPRRKELQDEIHNTLMDSAGVDATTLLPRLQSLWQEYKSLHPIDEIIQSMLKRIESLQGDSTSITMSLQVQDITAQHMEAINHLIESVHNRLTLILQKFYGAEFQSVIPDSSRKKLSDYIARQSGKVTTHDVLPESEIESQNEIDRMFKEK